MEIICHINEVSLLKVTLRCSKLIQKGTEDSTEIPLGFVEFPPKIPEILKVPLGFVEFSPNITKIVRRFRGFKSLG